MTPPREAIVLLSGGIDSAACAHMVLQEGHRVRALFVDYGQASADKEKSAALKVSQYLSVPLDEVVCHGTNQFPAGEILGRNAFLVFAALMHGDVRHGDIVIGIHLGTAYYDCTSAFFDSVNRLVSEYTDGTSRVLAPFLSSSKREIYRYFKQAALPSEITYSCEAGTEPPCGLCASCLDRRMLGC
jgi:7-cyano-7-deazaguanine synthase